MATYGPNTPAGTIPFSGFTPTLGTPDAIAPATTGYAQFNGMTQEDSRLSHALRHGNNRVLRRLMITLLGAAAGATATENRVRVQATPSTFSALDNGGIVPIETVALINRATTAADITNTVATISRTYAPTYAVDASGVAGGGKLGF